MRALLCAGWLVLMACKHDEAFTLEVDLTTHSEKVVGAPGKQLGDAKPELVVMASDPLLGEGARAVLAGSDRVKRGAVTVDITTDPASPGAYATVGVKIQATAVFAQGAQVTSLSAQITGKVKCQNVDARRLGGELGKKVLEGLDAEKLPD